MCHGALRNPTMLVSPYFGVSYQAQVAPTAPGSNTGGLPVRSLLLSVKAGLPSANRHAFLYVHW